MDPSTDSHHLRGFGRWFSRPDRHAPPQQSRVSTVIGSSDEYSNSPGGGEAPRRAKGTFASLRESCATKHAQGMTL